MNSPKVLRKVRFGMREFEDLLDRDEENQPGILEPGLGDGRVILIIGPPGSGKSTLALQMAWGIKLMGAREGGQDARPGDAVVQERKPGGAEDDCGAQPAHCLYFALEQQAKDLQKVARGFGWDDEQDGSGRIRDITISPENRRSTAQDGPAASQFAGWFGRVCRENEAASKKGLILVPKVTPRSLTDRSAGGEDLFARRLQDVHDLLDGYLRCRAGERGVLRPCSYYGPDEAEAPPCKKPGNAGPDTKGLVCPPLGLVVIDSLNVWKSVV